MPRKIAGPCPTTGCPYRAGQCPDHARGTRQQRGYDAEYDAVGRDYQRRMNDGERFTCWRCHRPINGTQRGRDWTVGHDDVDRSIIRGPEHPSCNYATSTRRGGG